MMPGQPVDVVASANFDGATNDIRTTLQPGELSLLDQFTPDLGSPRGLDLRKSRVLRNAMQPGVPIRGADLNQRTRELANNDGFLRLERHRSARCTLVVNASAASCGWA